MDRILQNKSLIFITIILAMVVFCYNFLDIPLALDTAHWHLHYQALLIAYTNMVGVIYISAFAALILGFMLHFLHFEPKMAVLKSNSLFLWGISIIAANEIKNLLKFAFGRTWPETWVGNNLSLVHDHVYGFNFFHGGVAYSSFPSGHMTITCAAMMVLALCFKRGRPIWALLAGFMAFSLLALDYHFLSDIVAGSLLGSWMAILTQSFIKHLAGLKHFTNHYMRLVGHR